MNHTELRAALAEDERIQQAATEGPWRHRFDDNEGMGGKPDRIIENTDGFVVIRDEDVTKHWKHGRGDERNFEFIAEARARWPERTRQLREALDEIELLKGAMAADDERLRVQGQRVGLYFSCDTAEHMADEIEWQRTEIERLKSLLKDLADDLESEVRRAVPRRSGQHTSSDAGQVRARHG